MNVCSVALTARNFLKCVKINKPQVSVVCMWRYGRLYGAYKCRLTIIIYLNTETIWLWIWIPHSSVYNRLSSSGIIFTTKIQVQINVAMEYFSHETRNLCGNYYMRCRLARIPLGGYEYNNLFVVDINSVRVNNFSCQLTHLYSRNSLVTQQF